MSTLSTSEIRKRLAQGLPDGLIITPLLEKDEQTKGNSVDLRLGNEFIVTQRTSFASIDPTKREEIESRIEEYQQHLTRRFHG